MATSSPVNAPMRRAVGEVVAIFGLVLVIIWVIKPLDIPALDLAMRLLVGVLIFASGWLHGDSRQRLGLRLDNFGKALTHDQETQSLKACESNQLLHTAMTVARSIRRSARMRFDCCGGVRSTFSSAR